MISKLKFWCWMSFHHCLASVLGVKTHHMLLKLWGWTSWPRKYLGGTQFEYRFTYKQYEIVHVVRKRSDMTVKELLIKLLLTSVYALSLGVLFGCFVLLLQRIIP